MELKKYGSSKPLVIKVEDFVKKQIGIFEENIDDYISKNCFDIGLKFFKELNEYFIFSQKYLNSSRLISDKRSCLFNRFNSHIKKSIEELKIFFTIDEG